MSTLPLAVGPLGDGIVPPPGSGTFTSVNVLGDPALTGAIVLVPGANITLTQVGQQITISATGAAGAAATYDFVFSPANPGPLPPNVFSTWAAVVAAVNGVGGTPLVSFDDTFSPVVIPAGAWAFTTRPIWIADPGRAYAGNAVQVSFAVGCTIDGVFVFRDVALRNTGAAAVFTAPPGNVSYLFTGFASATCPGASLIQKTTPGIFTVYVNEFAEFVAGNPVVHVTVPGVTFTAITDDSGIIDTNTIRGVAGSTYGARIGDAQGYVSPTQLTPSFPIAIGEQSIYVQYDDLLVPPLLGSSTVQGAIDALKKRSWAVIFRPGAPSSPPNYATWAEVEAAVNAVDGTTTVWFDGSLAPLVIPNTVNLDGKYRTTLAGSSDDINGLGAGTVVTVQSGAKLNHIREITANLIFEGVIASPVFVNASGKVLSVTYDSGFRLLAGSTSAFYTIGAGDSGVVRCDLGALFDNSAVPAVPIVDASAAAQFALISTRTINAGSGVFLGGGATPLLFVHDAGTNQQQASFYATGFSPLTPGANDIFFDQAEGVSYDDARVAPFFIPAAPHAYNVQAALDAIKGLLPATAGRGNILVFDASVPASFANVYKTWAEIVTAAGAAHGPLTIMFAPNSVMTSPGISYGDNLLLIGVGGFGPNPSPVITDNTGWNMSAVGLEIRDLAVLVQANGTAPFEGGNAGCQITLSGTTTITVDATSLAPAFSLHGPPVGGPATQRVILRDQARLVGGGPFPALACFELAPVGASLEIYAYEQSVVEPQSCSYTASGGITLRQSDGATIDPNQNVPFVATTLGTYVYSFTNAMAPVVTVNHQLKSKCVIVAVYDDTDHVVSNIPIFVIDEDNLTIDLTVFGAFAGTWKAVVRRLRRTAMVAPISGTHSGGLFLPQPGGGYINAFQAVVASIATLSLIPDNDPAGSPPGYNALADGSFALVSNGAIKQPWFLDKASLVAPNGTTCVLANSAGGNPANPGRWFLATAQSPTVSMAQASIIWRPGGVSAGNVYATFPEVVTAANLANGDVQIAVDDSITPAQVGAAEAINLHFRGGFVSGTGQKVKITVLPGGNVDNIGYSSSITFAQLVAVLGTYPLTWSEASVTAAGSFVRCFNTAFEPQPGSVAGGVAFIDGAKNVVIYAEECSFTGAGAEPTASYGLVSEGTAQVKIIATSKCNLTPFSFKPNAAGTTITVSFDASTDLPPVLTGRFPGTLDYVMIDIANEVLFDDTSTVVPVNGGQPSIVVNPVIGGKSAQEALQALKPFLLPFDQTNANLVAGILTVNHNLNQQFVQVIIADDTNQKVDAPITFVSPLSLTIDLNSFGVLSGGVDSWHVTVRI